MLKEKGSLKAGSRELGARSTELRAKPRKLCALRPERISKSAPPLALRQWPGPFAAGRLLPKIAHRAISKRSAL